MSEFNPADSIPHAKLRDMQQQLQKDYQAQQMETEIQQQQPGLSVRHSISPTTFDATNEQAFQYRSPSDFTNTRDFSSPRSAISSTPNELNSKEELSHTPSLPSTQQQPPINPIAQLSVGENAPTTNNMTELDPQRLSSLPTSEIPLNPIGQLADGEIKPNTKTFNNTDSLHTAPPTHPIAQSIISEDDPIRLQDTASPTVNFDEVAAQQSSGLSPRKRERDSATEDTQIAGPSALVTEEHMTEGTESGSTAAKLKAKVELAKERIKGRVEEWKEEHKAKEDEKKRRKDYEVVVSEADPSLGDRIRGKWDNTKHKLGDKIEDLKDRHEEKRRIKEREKELKESERIAGDRGQI